MKDQCIAQLYINEKGEIIHKVFSISLAQNWRLKIVFEGTYEECINKLKDFKYE